MEIRNKEWPPNIDKIKMVFPVDEFNPVFTYKDVLYNPTGLPVPEDLVKHEEVHEKQQKLIEVDNWWNMYLTDKSFRLSQEAEAYREQYRFIKEKMNRKARMPILKELSKNLSSKLYGNLISTKQAKELING